MKWKALSYMEIFIVHLQKLPRIFGKRNKRISDFVEDLGVHVFIYVGVIIIPQLIQFLVYPTHGQEQSC